MQIQTTNCSEQELCSYSLKVGAQTPSAGGDQDSPIWSGTSLGPAYSRGQRSAADSLNNFTGHFGKAVKPVLIVQITVNYIMFIVQLWKTMENISKVRSFLSEQHKDYFKLFTLTTC